MTFNVSTARIETADPFMTLVDAASSLLELNGSVASSGKTTPETVPTTASIAGCSDADTAPPTPRKQSFAELLMSVLDDPANQDVLEWMPDGKAFTIKNHKKFTMEHMPKCFNIRNMSSFVRKLGRWGFQRAHEKETCNSDIFKHKNFHRGDWDLCRKIKCIGRGSTSTSSGSSSPPIPATITAPVKISRSSGSPRSVQDIMVVKEHQQQPATPSYRKSAFTMTRSGPPSPAMVTPQGNEKALFRLEQARRRSAITRSPRMIHHHGLGNVTTRVVSAAMEALRRDQDVSHMSRTPQRRSTGMMHIMQTGEAVFMPRSSFMGVPSRKMISRQHHVNMVPLTPTGFATRINRSLNTVSTGSALPRPMQLPFGRHSISSTTRNSVSQTFVR